MKYQGLSERYCKLLPASRVLTLMYLPVSADLHDISPVISPLAECSGPVKLRELARNDRDQAQTGTEDLRN